MTVNGNPGPDLNQALLQAQLNASQARQGKGAPILWGYGDVQMTCFKLPPGLFNFDNKPIKLPNSNPGLFAKALASFSSSFAEDCKKMAQGASIIYSGDFPSGSALGGGGGFASIAGHSLGDERGIG